MQRTVIIANLSGEQLAYLRNLATENGIQAEFIVEGVTQEVEQVAPSVTPLTGVMLEEIATLTGKTVLEVATLATSMGISTVQGALAHTDIPSNIKELLENYL